MKVNARDVITFPDGILGFPFAKRFALLSFRQDFPLLSWLQSLEEPDLAFVVINPKQVRPDYHPSVSKDDLAALGLKDLSEAEMYALVSVSPGAKRITANLVGPLVVNRRLGIGRQVVLVGDDYSVKHDILEEWRLYAKETLNSRVKRKGA
ncbi:MAG TPA: flagellar assembly protein FliW [Clostridia bacterium]|nr:flagellar assembly protein FliW [Clostridia bacterium]